jgi:hypothetical protein
MGRAAIHLGEEDAEDQGANRQLTGTHSDREECLDAS